MVTLKKRICNNCWKVIPDDNRGFFGNIAAMHRTSYTSSILICNVWWSITMCDSCYRVKHPFEYKSLNNNLIKQRKQWHNQIMKDVNSDDGTNYY
jgi:hypothetical protein